MSATVANLFIFTMVAIRMFGYFAGIGLMIVGAATWLVGNDFGPTILMYGVFLGIGSQLFSSFGFRLAFWTE